MKLRVKLDGVVELTYPKPDYVDEKTGLPHAPCLEGLLGDVAAHFKTVTGAQRAEISPMHVSVVSVGEIPERPHFYRPHEGLVAKKVKGVEPERAVRLYKESPELWCFQLRTPLRVGSPSRDGKDFLVVSASYTKEDLRALRDAIDEQLFVEERLEHAAARGTEEERS